MSADGTHGQPAAGSTAHLSQALADAAAADPALRLSVHPNSANLRLDGQDGNELALHVRVRDGVANITVSGPASDAAVERSSDLRAALAGQGLRLGRIDRLSAAVAGTPADPAGLGGAKAKGRAQREAEAGGDSPLAAEEPVEEGAAPADLASGLQ